MRICSMERQTDRETQRETQTFLAVIKTERICSFEREREREREREIFPAAIKTERICHLRERQTDRQTVLCTGIVGNETDCGDLVLQTATDTATALPWAAGRRRACGAARSVTWPSRPYANCHVTASPSPPCHPTNSRALALPTGSPPTPPCVTR